MTGLRARKKAESRQRMLDAAKTLFVQNGYSKTNMEDIAERAGLGVATLYNYFNTKEGVFATMAREDMSVLQQRGEQTLAQQDVDPITAVYALLTVYNQVFEFISYAVLHEFQDQARAPGPLHDVSVWVNDWQQNQVARALRFCQSKGTLSAELNCELVAELVIDQLVKHAQRLGKIAAIPPDISHLKTILELVLHGWSKTD